MTRNFTRLQTFLASKFHFPLHEAGSPRHLKIDQPFCLKTSLTMGQAFRWRPLGDHWYSGVLGQRHVHVRRTQAGIEYRAAGPEGEIVDAELNDDLRRYFRLDTDDIEGVYADLEGRDSRIGPLLASYRGVRVLRQEPWECLASYICSANASVESITKNVEALADTYGNPVELAGEVRYTFPGPEVLAQVSENSVRELGLGFKGPRVIAAARRVTDNPGELERLREIPYPDTKRRLMEYEGIGPKIADCVCLMALDKLEAFPVDRHIRRAVEEYFWPGEKATDGAMVRWAQDFFGPHAGYVGQYLFLDRRLN